MKTVDRRGLRAYPRQSKKFTASDLINFTALFCFVTQPISRYRKRLNPLRTIHLCRRSVFSGKKIAALGHRPRWPSLLCRRPPHASSSIQSWVFLLYLNVLMPGVPSGLTPKLLGFRWSNRWLLGFHQPDPMCDSAIFGEPHPWSSFCIFLCLDSEFGHLCYAGCNIFMRFRDWICSSECSALKFLSDC